MAADLGALFSHLGDQVRVHLVELVDAHSRRGDRFAKLPLQKYQFDRLALSGEQPIPFGDVRAPLLASLRPLDSKKLGGLRTHDPVGDQLLRSLEGADGRECVQTVLAIYGAGREPSGL